MGEWKECKLGDVMIFGNGKERPKTEGIYPIYGGNGILGYCDQFNFQDEIIIIGRVGAYCGSLFYEDKRIWISDNALSAKPKGRNDIKFLFYFLKNLKLNQFAEGSSHPLLTQTLLNSIEITIPESESEQRAIASVLSSLDDKIDLLNRENQTLEQMAEAIFRQWFIEEADEEWEEGSLLELIELVGGGTPKTSIAEYWDGSIPWLSGKDISSNHKTFVTDTEKMITEDGLNNSSTKILPKYATIISARGTVGKYCLLAQPMAFSQTNYGILPKIEGCFFFTYLLINHLVEELRASAYGCVFDTITTSTFRDSEVPIPSNTEINEFEDSVSPFFQRICQNKMQIRTLEKLRDTLLPKLMSGEVRVRFTDSEVQK